MFGSSYYQNNQLASQTVCLPASYLNYLSSNYINLNSDLADNHVHITNRLHLFPGIEIIEIPDQENIKISINKRTLPFGYKSLQSQAVILHALHVLESICKIPADEIEPASREQMVGSICNALKNCLALKERHKDTVSSTKLIVLQSILAVSSLAVALIATAAYLFLFLPITMPVMLVVAVTAVMLGSLMGFFWGYFLDSTAGLIASLSTLRQAKTDCEKLSEAVERIEEKISHLSPNLSGVEEQSSSATATAPTRRSGSSVFLPPAAPANSPHVEQEDTATMAFKPH